jgi:hypothetical protein
MKRIAALVALIVVGGAGVFAAVTLAGQATTTTETVCASATAPGDTVAIDGSDVQTLSDAEAANCATTTYDVPTETETDVSTTDQTVTDITTVYTTTTVTVIDP